MFTNHKWDEHYDNITDQYHIRLTVLIQGQRADAEQIIVNYLSYNDQKKVVDYYKDICVESIAHLFKHQLKQELLNAKE